MSVANTKAAVRERDEHPTVNLKHPLYGQVEVDALLAPLIRLCWKLDIETDQCCQERAPGMAWVVFPTTDDLAQFLNLAQRSYHVELESWDEGGMDEDESGVEFCFCFNLCVWFPASEIPALIERFQVAAQADKDQAADE